MEKSKRSDVRSRCAGLQYAGPSCRRLLLGGVTHFARQPIQRERVLTCCSALNQSSSGEPSGEPRSCHRAYARAAICSRVESCSITSLKSSQPVVFVVGCIIVLFLQSSLSLAKSVRLLRGAVFSPPSCVERGADFLSCNGELQPLACVCILYSEGQRTEPRRAV